MKLTVSLEHTHSLHAPVFLGSAPSNSCGDPTQTNSSTTCHWCVSEGAQPFMSGCHVLASFQQHLHQQHPQSNAAVVILGHPSWTSFKRHQHIRSGTTRRQLSNNCKFCNDQHNSHAPNREPILPSAMCNSAVVATHNSLVNCPCATSVTHNCACTACMCHFAQAVQAYLPPHATTCCHHIHPHQDPQGCVMRALPADIMTGSLDCHEPCNSTFTPPVQAHHGAACMHTSNGAVQLARPHSGLQHTLSAARQPHHPSTGATAISHDHPD